MKIDKLEIESILPHQDPFLFIDHAIIEDKKATGFYMITGSEYFLKGHFKLFPVFPASIMMEALGQLAVLFLLKSDQINLSRQIDNKRVMFTSSDRTSCHSISKPGELLIMNISLKKIRAPLAKFDGFIVKNDDKSKTLSVEGLTLAFDFLK